MPTGGEFDEEDEGMPEAGVGLAGNEHANPVYDAYMPTSKQGLVFGPGHSCLW